MKAVNLKSTIALGFALILSVCAGPLRAGKPATIPAWFNDQTVYVIPGVSGNVVGVTNAAIASRVANPLYVILPVSSHDAQQVDHVLGVAAPGVSGYNPYWDIVFVTVNTDRDLTTDPFTSEEEILEAAGAGDVSLDDTGFVLLCQVVSK